MIAFFTCFYLYLLFYRSFKYERSGTNVEHETTNKTKVSLVFEVFPQVYGDNTMSELRVFEGQKDLKEGHKKMEDDSRRRTN